MQIIDSLDFVPGESSTLMGVTGENASSVSLNVKCKLRPCSFACLWHRAAQCIFGAKATAQPQKFFLIAAYVAF